MEDLVRGRRPVRNQLQRLADASAEILRKDSPSEEDIKTLRNNYDLLESTMIGLEEWDHRMKRQLFDDKVSEDVEDAEYRSMEDFRRIYLNVRADIDDFYSRQEAAHVAETASVHSSSTGKKNKYHLPEVKLKTFGGKLKDWLGWWSQFRQIHENDEIHTSNKFIYLMQAMEQGSEAFDLVDSYPMNDENYENAVEALRERFGRTDLLLQVYIRELLTLVISNVTSHDRLPLAQLYIRLESHLRSLNELSLNNADPATWLFPMVESSLSEETLRAWQRSSHSRTDGAEMTPKKTRLDLLMDFIKSEVRSDQQIALAQQGFQEKSNPIQTVRSKIVKPRSAGEIPTAAGLFAGQSSNCGFCDKPHPPEKCYKAKDMTMPERQQVIREKRLCFQCLRSGHPRKNCTSKVTCRKCGGSHYDIVCRVKSSSLKRGADSQGGSSKKVRFVENDKDGDLRIVTQQSNQCYNKVLLNTLKVKVEDQLGKFHTLRLVGDNGSQRSFGSTDTLQQTGAPMVGEEWLQTVLFGGEMTVPKRYPKKKITIVGMNGAEMTFELLEKQKLTGTIQGIPEGPWLQEAEDKGISFSDIGSDWSEADILIGNDYWGAIRTGRMVHLQCGLVAEETIFGWTLGGPVPVTMNAVTVQSAPSQDIQKLWTLEYIGIRDPAETLTLKEEEATAMEHFKQTVSRDEVGRYVVALPWKTDTNALPTNRKVSVQRLRSTTDRLIKTGQLKPYHEVFLNWEAESLISRVEDDDKGHIIPHRPVFKESSTTPVRPVFDASCRQARNPSLNDCLFKGPNLIEHIPTMLLRFGHKKIGVTADIRKAFQMIGVKQEDRKYQKFLWWEDETCTKMVVYQHNRVVFGITSSPFLLGATITVHLDTCEDREMAETLKKSFYVDNLLTSVDNAEEYSQLKKRSSDILKMANMELPQWASSIPEDVEDEIVPILGLAWNRREDTLSCNIRKIAIDDVVTKRIMLSTVAQVFDPMGYLAPTMLVPKLMVQDAWSQQCKWDDPVPTEVSHKFKSWIEQMESLTQVKICRYSKEDGGEAEVHILCDSSKDGMASVAFVKTVKDGKSKVQFLICKSRLTPMKKITIPRSELVSCVIGVRIAKVISEALEIPMCKFTFWSDSSTALAWIKRSGNWGVFVSNRVREILESTNPEQWHHVPGKVNPADLPSRGCSPRALLESKWWEGPDWLLETPIPFLDKLPNVNEAEVEAEVRKMNVSCMTNGPVEPPRFSTYRQNVAVYGWVLRFVNNCRARANGKVKNEYLSISELRKAEKVVLRIIQQSSFPENCREIGGIQVDMGEDGLLRVKSRLGYRSDNPEFIYPIILPKIHPMVDLLVTDVHRYHGHGGVQFLLSKLREKYWIIQSRRVIRRIIKDCVNCKRHTAKPLTVEPAPLPKKRVEDCEAFSTTGVDLAGPLYLRDGSKVWVVVFTCAVYRAVYLDLVTSLSTEDFVGALERFIALYGRPNTIYSDNGTNFVGAVNLFSSVDWASVERETNARQIQWIFNPPSAAWWGGFWERIIRLVKDLLKRMLRRSRLSYDQLRTCLCGIAATINDRPLTVVNEDNMDLVALTPAMFLRPRGYGHLPDLMEVDGLRTGYKRMKELQKAVQDRFRKEYLGLLVTRVDQKGHQRIRVGDVVLVGSDNRKRFEWPLGIVTEFLPGKDGITRVVRVKTRKGSLTRPLQRLYPLEVTRLMEESESGIVEPLKKADRQVSRFGRELKKPIRYGQWCHLVSNV